MMRVFYSPVVDEQKLITYSIEGEVITATLFKRHIPSTPAYVPPGSEEILPEIVPPEQIGEPDIFDFSAFPDGIAKDIVTTLPENPFVNVHREEGVLYAELINYITEDASEFEKFPVWIEVE